MRDDRCSLRRLRCGNWSFSLTEFDFNRISARLEA